MSSFHLRRFSILALMAGVLPAIAQTTTPSTCTTPPTNITALNLERVVALTAISSATTPTIPAAIQSAIASGALELRQQFSLNTSTNVITVTDFAAQPASSSPTLPGNIFSTNVVSGENFSVDKIYYSCTPTPSLLITGTIIQNYPASPVGNLIGAPAALSLTYTMDSPPNVKNVIMVYAGIASIFSATATGTLTVPTATTTTPGGGGSGPVIVIAGGLRQSTASKQFSLDASGSTNPTGLTLSYTAVQVADSSGGTTGIPQAATIAASGSKAGVFVITFAGGKGLYAFKITATDTGGGTASQVVVIDYNGI